MKYVVLHDVLDSELVWKCFLLGGRVRMLAAEMVVNWNWRRVQVFSADKMIAGICVGLGGYSTAQTIINLMYVGRGNCACDVPGPKGRPCEILCAADHQEAHNQSEEAQDTAKDLYDEDLDEEVGVGGVGEGGGRTCDADCDAAEEVAEADCDAAPEDGEAGEVVVGGVEVAFGDLLELGGVHDSDDDSVDSDDLAEDDAD